MWCSGRRRPMPAGLGEQIEAAFEARWGFRSRIMLRDLGWFEQLVAGDPVSGSCGRSDQAARLCAGAASRPARKSPPLVERCTGPERFEVKGDVLYLHAPDGLGKSKFAELSAARPQGARHGAQLAHRADSCSRWPGTPERGLGLRRSGRGRVVATYQVPVLGIDAQGSAFSFARALLQELDRDAVGRLDEGHVAVARRPVDGDAAVHQAFAGGVDVVDLIGEVAEIAAALVVLRIPVVGQFDQRRLFERCRAPRRREQPGRSACSGPARSSLRRISFRPSLLQ